MNDELLREKNSERTEDKAEEGTMGRREPGRPKTSLLLGDDYFQQRFSPRTRHSPLLETVQSRRASCGSAGSETD